MAYAETQTTIYDRGAMNEVEALKPRIAQVAAELGLRPEAIFGALVEENHAYRSAPRKNALGDAWVRFRDLDHESLRQFYQRAQRDGTLDNHSALDKFSNVTLNDVGPYNIQIGTAIRLVSDYAQNTPPERDPLGLRRYASDYPALVNDLMKPSNDTAPAIAGLMLAEAQRYMARHTDPQYWDRQNRATQDAVLITYYNMGPAAIERNRPNNMQEHGGVYMPQPGAREVGGKNHITNAQAIGDIFGHTDYKTRTDTAPSDSQTSDATEPSRTVAPSEPTTPRPPSHRFLAYSDRNTVRLKPGGTLSDIVAVERSRGNPITASDLRIVNELDASMDKKLALDQLLVVPRRRDGRLLIDCGPVELNFNPADGSYQYTIQEAESGVVGRVERSRDAASGAYTDRFALLDPASGTVRREQIHALDAGHGEQYQHSLRAVGDDGEPAADGGLAGALVARIAAAQAARFAALDAAEEAAMGGSATAGRIHPAPQCPPLASDAQGAARARRALAGETTTAFDARIDHQLSLMNQAQAQFAPLAPVTREPGEVFTLPQPMDWAVSSPS